MSELNAGTVAAVCASAGHTMGKPTQESIELVAGLGVQGDVHAGVTVQHRSRVRRDPSQPNLRQVHLVAGELFADLRGRGFDLAPGVIGENVTTAGLDLIGLPTGSRLRLGESAVVEITGLRNPCVQLEGIQPGLMKAVLDHDDAGQLVRRAGVMAVVVDGGQVRPGDRIEVVLPAQPHRPLQPV